MIARGGGMTLMVEPAGPQGSVHNVAEAPVNEPLHGG